MATFGERLKAAREGAGLTPFELSMKAAVPEQNIRKWEGGAARPVCGPQIVRVAAALDTSLDELVGEPAETEA